MPGHDGLFARRLSIEFVASKALGYLGFCWRRFDLLAIKRLALQSWWLELRDRDRGATSRCREAWPLAPVVGFPTRHPRLPLSLLRERMEARMRKQ